MMAAVRTIAIALAGIVALGGGAAFLLSGDDAEGGSNGFAPSLSVSWPPTIPLPSGGSRTWAQ